MSGADIAYAGTADPADPVRPEVSVAEDHGRGHRPGQLRYQPTRCYATSGTDLASVLATAIAMRSPARCCAILRY
eukprot:2666951-Rhodomonas_salina.4